MSQHIDAQALQLLSLTLERDDPLDAVPLRIRREGGTERQCLLTAPPLAIGGPTQIVCVVRDITDQLAGDAPLRKACDNVLTELEEVRREADAVRHAQGRAEGLLKEDRTGFDMTCAGRPRSRGRPARRHAGTVLRTPASSARAGRSRRGGCARGRRPCG